MTKFDDIKIPHNIKEETKKTIKKGRSLKKKRKFKHVKAASIIILSMGICIGTLNPSLASEIPFLNNIFKDITLNPKEDYTKYIKDVNLTKTVNGVSLTIDQIVCDGHKIDFSYTIKSKNKLLHQQEEGFYKDRLFLNMKVNVKNGTAIESESVTKGYTDDYTYVGRQSYQLTFNGKKAPKTIKVSFLVDNIYTYKPDSETVDEKVEGPFNFNLKISPNTNVVVIDVNESKNGFTVDSLEISPYTISVNVKLPKEFILNNDDSTEPYLELSSTHPAMSESSITGKNYKTDTNPIEYKIKHGVVYDSIVTNNTYKVGYYGTSDSIIVRFLDLKNQSKDNVTEFKIPINKQL